MIVADLEARELERRLAGPGLRLRTGPVVTEVRSRLAAVRAGIALHYAAHPVATREEFADFHVSVEQPRGLRRFLRPQVLFRFEAEAPFRPLPAAQAFPMLEWGLNWCVSSHCHRYLVVHAAALERHGRALLLPSPPGSGKSTLAAALVARGWRLFSDELALVDPATGWLTPVPRPISLKNESIDAVRAFWPAAVLGPGVRDTIKGTVAHLKPPEDSVRRAHEAARPGLVVVPNFAPGAATRLEPMPRAAAFMLLADNAFNYSLHGRRGFDALADLVGACGTFELGYGGALEEAVTALDALARVP